MKGYLRRRPEEITQRACVQLLQLAVPEPPSGPSWTAINPSPSKSKAVAGISKAMGLRPGVPDLLLVFRGRSIFVEFKAGNNALSENQQFMRKEIVTAGGIVEIARSLDDFVVILRKYHVPLNIAAML